MNKFNAKRTELDGKVFASKGEAARYAELKIMERAGMIQALETQPKFVLQEGFTDEQGQRHRPITYIADFRYVENGMRVVEDFKGRETEVFKLKRKLFAKAFPGYVFRISKATRRTK